ncbi:MAG: hypothetical protein NTW86_06325 [Candidatus Sumerlaeota bacterium]|nr:hypothetical protein [Candidatus Sumerlaeota bacterium]
MNRWYERAGGYWVSIALHILFFSVMVSMTVVRAKLTEPPPVEVTIVAAAMESGDEAPADAAQPAPAFEASPVMETGNEDNVSTVPPDVKESEEETNEPPAPATEEAKKEPPKPEATKEPTPTPKPDPAQQAEMAERERQKRLDELVQRDWEAYQQAASAPANNDKLSASGAKLKEAFVGEEVKMKG